MSFDLLLYVPKLSQSSARRIEASLAGLGETARVELQRDGQDASIEVEFDPDTDESTDGSIDFGALDRESISETPWASPGQREQLQACRLEGMLSTSAGRSDGALSQQILLAIAVMEACGGVLLDPQASASGLPALQELRTATPGVEQGYFFDPAHAKQWAAAMAAVERSQAKPQEPASAGAGAVLGKLGDIWRKVTQPAPAPAASLRDRWDQGIARDLAYYEDKARSEASFDVFDVGSALLLRCWRFDSPLGPAIANRAIRKLRHEVETKAYEQIHPNIAQHGELYVERWLNDRKAGLFQALAYAAAAETGIWDVQFLREAAAANEANVRTTKRWSGEPDDWQSYTAVLLRLAVGDLDEAAATLAIKRGFKCTKPIHDRLKLIVTDLQHGAGVLDPNSRGAETLREMYEAARQPEPNWSDRAWAVRMGSSPEFRRFEFALLRERYLLGNTGTPDWKRLFTSISE